MKITINDKEYDVEVFQTDEEKAAGLQNVESMDEDEGALFIFDEEEEQSFWMKDTTIKLDIIFINKDWIVNSVYQGEPESEEQIVDEAMYVLELNVNSEVKPGDEVDIDDFYENLELRKLYVMGSDGKPQAELDGGERIFSRIATRKIVKYSKRAYDSKSDVDYKRLGRFLFKELEAQNTRKPQYVEE